MFHKLLKALGLVWDGEGLRLPKQNTVRHQPKTLPDNVITTKTGVFAVEDTEDSRAWQRVQNDIQATTDQLTQNDIKELDKRGVAGDLVKASEFKRVWQSNISALDGAKFLNCSHRTAQKYWAAFNASK